MQEGSDHLVLSTQDGPLATIRLNRPGRLNALTADLLMALRQHVNDAQSDPKISAILLTGSGNGFCTGQDLIERDPRRIGWPLDLEAIQKKYFHQLIREIKSSNKPIIVGMNGIASGAGVGLALAGDVIVASEAALFDFSFVRLGLSVDAACGWHLVQALGPGRALPLLLTGASLPAPQAAELGLIWRSVPSA